MTASTASVVASDEAALVLQAQKGDRQAFTALVERYWNSVYRWLYHLSRHRQTAEDLTQETLLKAFAAIGSFQAGTNFRAWLFRIAYNGFLNQREAERRQKRPLVQDLASSEPLPPEQLENREFLRLIGQCVGALSHDFRAAFLLRVEQELSFREIGGVLGITEETARWRVFKARKKLLLALEPYWRGKSS
jgi:RNA polymerase sigma-70 factor (ECF subfamily)